MLSGAIVRQLKKSFGEVRDLPFLAPQGPLISSHGL